MKTKKAKAEKEHSNFCRMFTKQYLRMKRLDEYKRKEPKFHTAFTDLITYVYSNLQNLLKNKSSPRDYSNDTKMDGKKIIGNVISSSAASTSIKRPPIEQVVETPVSKNKVPMHKASRAGKFEQKHPNQVDLKNVR
jgi:hypothetical protein